MQNNEKNLLFYVTSHGLGHATRAINIISNLLQAHNSISITLVTGSGVRLPHSLLPVALGTNTLTFRESSLIDPGLLQSSPTTIDTRGTWELQEEFIANLPSKVEEEVLFLLGHSSADPFDKASRFDLAIMDATPFPALACKRANIPTLLISNFTFDSIFGHLATDPAHRDIVKKYTDAYNLISNLYRLPGFIPMPSFTNVCLDNPQNTCQSSSSAKRSAIAVPLLYRPIQVSRSKLLQSLNIPSNSHILFICFGSWKPNFSSPSASSSTFNFTSLVPDPTIWHIISLSPLPISPHPHLHIIPSSSHTPSLISASSVVLGKLGYGLCSETVGLNTPLIYIRRPQFLEEEGLIKLMDSASLGLEMDQADFDGGNWVPSILSILESRPHPAVKQERAVGEESEGTMVVCSLIKGLLGVKALPVLSRLPELPDSSHSTLVDSGLTTVPKA